MASRDEIWQLTVTLKETMRPDSSNLCPNNKNLKSFLSQYSQMLQTL